MYPTEGWAGLDFTEARALLRRWISDSHDVVGKPFVLGEWNASTDKTEWWRQIYAEMEASGGDGDAFWWYPASSSCGGFDSGEGCPEHAVFRTHAAAMKAKSGVGPTVNPTTTAPTRPTTPPTTRSTTAPTTPPTTRPTTPPTTRPTTAPTTPPTTRQTTPPTPPTSRFPSDPTIGTCTATYKLVNQWQGGFQAEVTVTNTNTTPSTGWTVSWSWANGQTITQLWSGTWTPGNPVVVRNVSWNGALPPNGTTSFGFTGTWNGTNTAPTPGCTRTP
jgi:mannan endo-1,4-beta-mannosidase